MVILGIETSCDETAASVVRDGSAVLSNVIASSKESFAALAGVIPEEAAREQLRCIVPVVEQTLTEASLSWKDIDAIAVTRGPGLLGSLLVGTIAARALASLHNKPLIGVHHTLGHLCSVTLGVESPLAFPALALSVSGGHSELWLRISATTGELLGRARDDAAGEAFDKGASLLGLPYPGGPVLAELATKGNADAFPFPLPLHDDPSFDFSFSGLKTALRYTLRDTPDAQTRLPDLAASYELAICKHLLHRMEKALEAYPHIREIHLVGGVSANATLQKLTQQLAERHGSLLVRTPTSKTYCTDNAAMIAAAGYFLVQEQPEQARKPFITSASLPLEESLSGRMPEAAQSK